MEEATYLEIKNRPEARTFPANLLSAGTVSPVTLLYHAPRVWKSSNVGWRERDDDDDTATTVIVVGYAVNGYSCRRSGDNVNNV